MKKTILSKTIAVLLCLVLGLSCAGPAWAAETAPAAWAQEIPALLAAGDYLEGQVVAGVRWWGQAGENGLFTDGEEIMEVGQTPRDGELHLVYLQREDLTTEELLQRLARDRRVVFAEPNYCAAQEAEGDAPESQAASGEAGKKTREIRVENVQDLTPQQWSSSDQTAVKLEGVTGSSLHVENFDAQTGNMEGEPVVVAVLDSALDFTHPELAAVAYTFTPEQQAALGCDVHGFNATLQSADGKLTYYDGQVHGTHCAGILGGAWDGKGISGVASNVRLVSVQNCIDDGKTSLVNALRGMDFIDRANALGCGIAVTSNSWGLLQASKALDAAVRKLGEKWGVVTLFAAGNDSRDLATAGDIVGTLGENPYVVVVSAMDLGDELAPYSSWGALSVDVGAPGSGILSSINVNEANAEYLADALPENKFYEGFEGEATGVKFSWLTDDQTVPAQAAVTGASHFAGKQGLKLTLDPSVASKGFTGLLNYRLLMDLGDVSAQGVQAGDFLGFTAGAAGSLSMGAFACGNQETGKQQDLLADRDCKANTARGSMSAGWISAFVELPATADWHHLTVSLYLSVAEGTQAVYLDSLGIGSQLVPYTIYDGTSMACPAAAGFAAVLKSREPQLSGKALAARLKASVRPNESLAGRTRTGGTLDFLAVQNAAPVLEQVEVSGTTVTVTGTGLPENGTVTVSRIVAGKDPAALAVKSAVWSEKQVVVTLEQEARGILAVEVENDNGSRDTAFGFAGKGEEIYAQDLPLETGTGETFVMDGNGDDETAGPLVALDGKLYFLPVSVKEEQTSACREMFSFDPQTQTWQAEAAMPEYLTMVSAAGADGKLAVKGGSLKVGLDGSPVEDMDSEVRVWVYDPAAGAWTSASAQGVSAMDTLAQHQGKWILAGGGGDITSDPVTGEMTQLPASVREYDPQKGAGAVLAMLSDMMYRPKVASREGVLTVCDLGNSDHVDRVVQGKTRQLKNALPAFLTTTRDSRLAGADQKISERYGTLLAVQEGVLLVGPTAADGSSDTFLLRDGDSKFRPCSLRASDGKISFSAAAADQGKVYVMGSSPLEPEQRFFRAAETADLQVLPPVFSDVAPESYCFSAVQWAAAQGVAFGLTGELFGPGETCTRAQAVTFLWRAAGEPKASRTDCPFTDVGENAYYYPAMLWAVEKGITNGTTATTFEPNALCTRAQTVTFLHRYAGLPQAKGSQSPFTDVKTSGYYYSAMLWAVEQGITTGTTATTFAPHNPCTRGQAVTFLYRGLKGRRWVTN